MGITVNIGVICTTPTRRQSASRSLENEGLPALQKERVGYAQLMSAPSSRARGQKRHLR